ncbi:MAG: hypothetical protein NTV34_12485, partial [Proteobacteria bacterium]|nr:hypothetical protein [Pseudomonadota bacterium]
ARQAGLDLNAPYLKSPDLKEGRNLIDWVYILEQMYRTGAKIHRDLGIHRREIADYGGNRGVYGGLLPESYFHDATIMLERADKLAKLFKYLIQSGFKPTGIPVSLFIPGPHEGTNSHTLTYGVFTYLLLELQAGKTKNLLGPNIFDAGYLSWPLTRDDFVANKIRLQTLTFAAPK